MHRTKLVGLLAATAATFGATAAVASADTQHFDVNHTFAAPPTTADCQAQIGIACYGATQFETAYGLNSLYANGENGAGKTIAIVDSFGSPTIKADLAQFDSDYGLAAPPSFKIIQPAGKVPAYDGSALRVDWAQETSLDVEYAHAIAPGANILLVETPVAETEGPGGLQQIDQAENYVIKNHLADVITQSFDATENTFASAAQLYQYRKPYIAAAKAGITVLAAAGDAGATNDTSSPDAADWYPFRTVGFPASDPLVTAVGGTHLQLDATGNRTAPDSVWNDGQELCDKFSGGQDCTPAAGGGGTSMYFGRPSFQNGVASVTGNMRGIPDISMSAAVDGGALVYMSLPGTQAGYQVIGGTSEASPEFSGIIAISDQINGTDLGDVNPLLYGTNGAGFEDITIGNNSVSFTNPAGDPYPGPQSVTGYNAVPGYDLASGWGTVGPTEAPSVVTALTKAGS